MKKILFILLMLVVAITAYNQSSRQVNHGDNNPNREQTNSNAKSSTTRSGSQLEKRSPATSNQSPTTQRQPNTGTNTTSHSGTTTNSNENTRRSENIRNREYSQPVRTPVNTEPERHQSQQDNSWDHRSSNPNQPVNVNHTYPRHPEFREYESPRIDRERHVPIYHYDRPPVNREYREHHYVYRAPVNLYIYWSHDLYNNYVRMYPMVRTWDYPIGYRIESIPAYDADHYKGAVVTVYGSINEAYYSRATDEIFLYYGPYYPYQDFTVVIPGWVARQYSSRPEIFFNNQNLAVTGLITTFEGDPEIVIKEPFQLNLY
jgi:hypothetical protein